MRIGFDVDGVLANFIAAYQRLFVRISGVDLFQPGDDVNPPCWDWPQFRGYGDDIVASVWAHIGADPTFWARLAPLDGADTLSMCIADMEKRHDIYFITARFGKRDKQQTETWLRNYLGLPGPTVLISSDKGACAGALRLDAYIDDNLDNIRGVVQSNSDEQVTANIQGRPPKFYTRPFLLNRAYNQGIVESSYTRVRSVGQMLDYLNMEGL